MQYTTFKYDFIYIWFYWQQEKDFSVKSVGLSLNKPKLSGHYSIGFYAEKLKLKIIDHLDGNIDRLPTENLDMSLLTHFSGEVLCELRKKVNRGQTVSYKVLAELVGHPRSARAVGTVLRKNPFPLFFPCHRVIKNDGSIGLFQGTEEGSKLKRMLLIHEGAAF